MIDAIPLRRDENPTNKKVSYKVVKYSRDGWTVVRTVEEDYARVNSEGAALALIRNLKDAPSSRKDM